MENNEINKIKDLINNYSNMEKSIVEQLSFNVSHGTTIGGFREEIWKQLFENVVPKKFSVERSVFIIDSTGNVSNEVDLAIFDEQYTPYIFKYGTIKFIPIEAVAVVIECKSKTIDVQSWCESIDKLKTSFYSVARMATKMVVNNSDNINKTTQSSTRPIKILCYAAENSKDKDKDGKLLKDKFDFIIYADKKDNKLNITCKNENEKLTYWHNSLNHNKRVVDFDKDLKEATEQDIELKGYEVANSSILTLIFQLNQLLMLINNPMLFPHMSYVKLFNNPELELKFTQDDAKK